MTIKPIEPVEVVRDADGWFSHPQYMTEPEFADVEWLSQQEFDKYTSERGIETGITYMELDDDELYDRYVNDGLCECSAWEPSRPAGDGWFVLSIHDTEDGPICVWGRRLQEKQP